MLRARESAFSTAEPCLSKIITVICLKYFLCATQTAAGERAKGKYQTTFNKNHISRSRHKMLPWLLFSTVPGLKYAALDVEKKAQWHDAHVS